jgi:hypothetical protein
MSRSAWGMKYEDWERHAVPATDEKVREAMSYERAGWPMPISGDYTLQGRLPATHCSCADPVPLVTGSCGICRLQL